MQKRCLLLLFLAMVLVLSGCRIGEPPHMEPPAHSDAASSADPGKREPEAARDTWTAAERLSVLFVDEEAGYTIATSDLLDTLFVAGALYYNLESDNLLPAGQARHDDARAYFAPYGDHPLMGQLSPYVNDFMQDINGETVDLLVRYVVSGNVYYEDSPVYAGADDVEALIDALYRFYVDTDAAAFFRSSPLHGEMEEYIPQAAGSFPIPEYFGVMEDYTGNRAQLYGDTPLYYYSVVTPYRPFMASFYPFSLDGDAIYFVSQQSPYSMMDGSLDMRQTLETAIHESLHMYINQGVWEQSDLIDALTEGLGPEQVTCPMYQSMPWHRITDEAVVRVVQAGIYRQVYGDSQAAFDEILVKELRSGIVNLDAMYELLLDYEEGRERYPTIDDFAEVLIRAYYEDVGVAEGNMA